MSEENFDLLYKDMIEFSENKDLFVQDLFQGSASNFCADHRRDGHLAVHQHLE